jgi:hypothetical protein
MKSVISMQSAQVQNLCGEFTKVYQQNRNLIGSWGRLLQEIRDGLTVPEDLAENEDPQGATFGAICRELGIPRSTAYHYIDTFLITSTYPQWLQDASTQANLNLALKHVQNAYENIREDIPKKPNPLEVAGVVAQLKAAKPAQEEDEPITKELLVKALARLIKRGMKIMPAAAVVQAVGQAMTDAKVPQEQQDSILHTALDVVDKNLGIKTR